MSIQCSICWEDIEKSDDATHLALYCTGSEGITVCLDCRMALTDVARKMMCISRKSRKAGYLAAKEVASAEACKISFSDFKLEENKGEL